MKRKGLSTMFVGVAATLLVLAGCGQKSTAKVNGVKKDSNGKPRIAVVLKGMDQEFFKLEESGAKQAFKDFNVDGTFLAAPTQTDDEKLINILEDELNKNPDAVVVEPSTESVNPVLDRYKEKNIPVLLIDTNINWNGKTTYIGTDNYSAGQAAGKFLASKLSKGDEIAILEGVSGTAVNEDRVKGVKDALKKAGMNVDASLAADFDRVKAVSVMENILTAHPKVKGIFTANDEMAMGAYKAVKNHGLNIPIVGIDGTSDALKSISQGGVTATVAQDPYEMGYKGVENALNAIKGKKVYETINTGINLITKSNSGKKLSEVTKYLSNVGN